MHTYFDTAPAAAIQNMFDGHQYIYSALEMVNETDGKRHVQQAKQPRLMRVSHVVNGVAYAELGKAGDAIAYTADLPPSVVTRHDVDQPQGTIQ